MYICVYIYIYIYTYACNIYIYIYIYRLHGDEAGQLQERQRRLPLPARTGNNWYKL